MKMWRLTRGERGSIAVVVILFLPIAALIVGLVLDVGYLFVARYQAGVAADLGALAGAQDVDLERLATGERWLVEEQARRDANDWTRANLRASLPHGQGEEATVQVRVYNATAKHPLVNEVSGRILTDPTVVVSVEVPVRLHFVAFLARRVLVRVSADASVVPKE